VDESQQKKVRRVWDPCKKADLKHDGHVDNCDVTVTRQNLSPWLGVAVIDCRS
jgi:hypothetical protein